VREAISTLVGIKIMMVTGEHPNAAEAIARKINLVIGNTKATLVMRTGSRWMRRRWMKPRCMRSSCMGIRLVGLVMAVGLQ
jgi:magnesium-transporting ATPase (P-type)